MNAAETIAAPLSQTPEFLIWKGMRQQCTNKNHSNYRYYGGKGIRICPRWKQFKNFLNDMGPRPTSQHNLIRKNKNQGFNPRNCEWGLHSKACATRSTCNMIAFNGKKQSIAAWARELGYSRAVLSYRINRGWSVSDALTVETGKQGFRSKD